MCKTEEKDMLYAKLESILNQCPCRDAFIVHGDFNAVTGTERAAYDIYVGPHGFGNKIDNISFLLNFARP